MNENGAMPAAASKAGLGLALLVVLVGINLRAFFASTSPLLADIRADTGLDITGASLLTMLPMFAMGIMSLLGVSLAARTGTRGGIFFGLAAIAVACASRGWAREAALLLASAALAGVGVGVVQALMPAVIKRAYPRHTGMAMGLYSSALMGGGGLGAIGSPWVAQRTGHWQAGLAVWAVPAAIAAVGWWIARRGDRPAAPAGAAPRVDWRPCLRNRRAWLLALYFGLINGGYASLMAWLPPFYVAQGWSQSQAGSLLALMTLAQLSSALGVPVLARGQRNLRPWLLAMLALQVAGYAALVLNAPLPALVVVALGAGLGGAFALCLTLALDHLPHPEQAGALTAFMQGLGFMLAALSPLVTGWVREHAGGFGPAWIYLGAVAALLLLPTLRFDPRRYPDAVGGLFTPRGPG